MPELKDHPRKQALNVDGSGSRLERSWGSSHKKKRPTLLVDLSISIFTALCLGATHLGNIVTRTEVVPRMTKPTPVNLP